MPKFKIKFSDESTSFIYEAEIEAVDGIEAFHKGVQEATKLGHSLEKVNTWLERSKEETKSLDIKKLEKFIKGSSIQFTYKKRLVIGRIVTVFKKTILLSLETDYPGKNVFYEVGEKKSFIKKEIKELRTAQNTQS